MRRESVRIGDLAKDLGVPVWTVRRLADSGRIPFERTSGGHRVFDPSAVRTALAAATDELGAARTEPDTAPAWDQTFDLDGLEEHLVWREMVDSTGLDADTPAAHLIECSMNEMVNNAIDHSGGSTVRVRVWADTDRLAFRVQDDGEGAFAHLRRGLGLADDFEAIAALTKGKQTTWRDRHTGEGVFFTSKMNDLFQMSANGKRWTVDNLRQDQAVGTSPVTTGTLVFGQVPANTTRTATEVFQSFMSDDFAFDRTRPSVKLASLGMRFASRSEARRLLSGLDEFTEIDADFAGVREVGQGFVDELLRVWPQEHPGKTITPVNMNPAVEFMVRRGLGR